MNQYVIYYKNLEMPPEHTSCVSKWANTEKEAIKFVTHKASKVGDISVNKKGAKLKVIGVERIK